MAEPSRPDEPEPSNVQHSKGIGEQLAALSAAEAEKAEDVAALVYVALGVPSRTIQRETLTLSGNAIFHAELVDGREVAVRISARRGSFAYTQHNLSALGSLGLIVPTVLASGPTSTGGSFVILNWIPGRDLQFELSELSDRQATHIAETVSDWQERVTSLPESRGFGWAPIGAHAPHARWTDLFGLPATAVTPPEHAAPLERLRGRLRAVRRDIEPYFASLRPICFLDDLTIKNVIVEHGQLRGIIDVDFVCYGDPLLSIGTTLAHIAADVGEAGHLYGHELIRCAKPSALARRAIYFYSALWVIGFLASTLSAGDAVRADELTAVADHILRTAETRLPA
ncbi:MAG: phosphotransferase [Paraburkholderia sp.]|uniref:phosphotransferase family protein n=1 Tax=Paraburkholderia sp. TaxID=1926495 RepID=UPI003C5BB4FB